MKGRPIRWLPEELDWIAARADWPRARLLSAFRFQFGRPEVTQSNLSALCKRKGWLTGRSGRFVKGQAPHNKGRPMPFHPSSAATRFKPGAVPPNRLPLWSERVGKDGYLEMKVPARNPYTGHATRFMHKHRWLWEQVNGPLPKGHALKCLDGNRQNTDPDNWIAIPRGLLPRLNGKSGRNYDTAPAELQPVILKIARLEHAARNLGR